MKTERQRHGPRDDEGRQSLAMPVTEAIRALAHLPPGTRLLEPREPALRALGHALREAPTDENVFKWLVETHPSELASEVVDHELGALVRVVHMYRDPGLRLGRPPAPQDMAVLLNDDVDPIFVAVEEAVAAGDLHSAVTLLRNDPTVREVVIRWSSAGGFVALAAMLDPARDEQAARLTRLLTEDEVRQATERAVAAQIPAVIASSSSVENEQKDSVTIAALDARVWLEKLVIHEGGFSITAGASIPKRTERSSSTVTTVSAMWSGLERVVDDIGFHYMIRTQEDTSPHGSPSDSITITYHCYPAPHPRAAALTATARHFRTYSVKVTTSSQQSPEKTVDVTPALVALHASLHR